MLYWIKFFAIIWITCGIMADIILTFNDDQVLKNWFRLRVFYLHLLSMICGMVYMFVVVLFLVDEIREQSKEVKSQMNRLN